MYQVYSSSTYQVLNSVVRCDIPVDACNNDTREHDCLLDTLDEASICERWTLFL